MTQKPYICAFHLRQLSHCETESMRNWRELISRGTSAYNECRFPAAEIYLQAALEIALYRYMLSGNTFTYRHLTRPADLLVHILCADQRFDEANRLLSKLSSRLACCAHRDRALTNQLVQYFIDVEQNEKQVLTAPT